MTRNTDADATVEPTAGASAVRRVAFTMLPVQDVERARRFYEGTLGLTAGLHGGRGGLWWVEYDLPGGGCIALTNTRGHTPSASAGATLALEVDDLPALIDRLKGAGAHVPGELVRGPRCHMITCLDSEGNALLLHQRDPSGPADSAQ